MVADLDDEQEVSAENMSRYRGLLSTAFGLRAAALAGLVMSSGAATVVFGLGAVFAAPVDLVTGMPGSTCCP